MIGSQQPLATRYDVALLDLDGVVYLGEQPVVGAAQSLASARQAGMRLAFVTNNASRTPDQVAELLHRVGVPATADEVVNSAQAAAHYLADRLPAGAPVLVLGTTGLIDALVERGLKPVFSAEEQPAAVVQGFFPGLDWHALAEGAVAIGRGVPWLATNLDATVPSPRGPLPGNGSLVAALRHATGRTPAATGKPDPAMHAESVERSRARHPIVVGDRLDTDIEGARRASCDSLLVLSGVTDAAKLLSARPLHRPDYVGRDVSALLHGHPEVTGTGELVSCGSARVRISGTDLRLSVQPPDGGAEVHGAEVHGAGVGGTEQDGLNGLRALAEASWRLHDAGGTVRRITGTDAAATRLIEQLGLGHATG
ncbi:HAD-IIA family hydrolase [Jatrophihabitans sp.]|jgi:HAD superfamily hydrolase (TIGR01450 family)|uniref:HAD-IIA family hydrolase n=1 Tax=Jatrophihabitans sp. TaxID=1932789 RepID=UPI002EE1BB2E